MSFFVKESPEFVPPNTPFGEAKVFSIEMAEGSSTSAGVVGTLDGTAPLGWLKVGMANKHNARFISPAASEKYQVILTDYDSLVGFVESTLHPGSAYQKMIKVLDNEGFRRPVNRQSFTWLKDEEFAELEKSVTLYESNWASNMPIDVCQAENSCITVEQALSLARNGWKEGIEKVSAIEGEITEAYIRSTEQPFPVADLEGQEPIVDSYLRGEPEDMMSSQPQRVPSRAVRVFADLSVRCDACGTISHDHTPTPPDFTYVRGAAIIAALRVLSRLGYRPEVYVGVATTLSSTKRLYGPGSSSVNTSIITKVQSSGDFLDEARLSYALCNDSFVRRIVFRAIEEMNLSVYLKESSEPPFGMRFDTGIFPGVGWLHEVDGIPSSSNNSFIGFPKQTPMFGAVSDYGSLDLSDPARLGEADMLINTYHARGFRWTDKSTVESAASQRVCCGNTGLPMGLSVEKDADSNIKSAIRWVIKTLDSLGVKLST